MVGFCPRWKASCQSRIDVGVGVDETRHDDTAMRIYELSLRIFLLHGIQDTNLFDVLAIGYDCAILQIWICAVSCDHFYHFL